MKRVSLFKIISLFFLMIFIPTLFCIFMWGNEMDYNPANKVIALYGNKRLMMICLPVLVTFIIFIYLTKKVQISKRVSTILNVCLGIMFMLVFLVNVKICECIHIAQGWDVSCVVGTAYELHKGIPIGDADYYSLCPNNVPITFVLYKLFSLADSIKGFPYVNDFLWVIVICALVSIAGYLTCITVKKISKSFSVTIITFILYVGCVGFTPWKTVPYTDMFSILFPILCINLYVFGYYSERKWKKYVLWFLIFSIGFIGTLIKPTVFIVPIAIALSEVIQGAFHWSEKWKELLIKIALIVVALIMYSGIKSFVYKDVGYEQNKEIQLTAMHYLMMGLNEDSTGSFAAGDVAISGNVPLLEDRTDKQIEVIRERLEEKGFGGYLNFLLRKMVMTFNDGTFGWGREGVYTNNVYPVYSDGAYVHFVQKVFVPELEYSSYFNTYSQTIWLLIIFCIPGFCLMEKQKKEVCLSILVSVVGVIFYLMLFEARARYLICFLPILILMSGMGVWGYYKMFVRMKKRLF